jgi:GlpG protein
MADLHQALELDIGEDLLPLSALLHQRGLHHRIYEEGGKQVLMVQAPQQVPEVVALYNSWRAGEFRIERVARPAGTQPPSAGQRLSRSGQLAPVTMALIGLSVLGFLLVYLHAPREWLGLLTFTPFAITGGVVQYQEFAHQYWRLITPAFIHFGWLHIAFNSLWLWELGSKIERVMGPLNMLLLFVTIALVSNTAQFAFGGPGLFGGMSGVVYGLLGFSWVGAKLQPTWTFQPPTPVILMMVGWLVFCLVGVIEVLGFGAIANAAHVGGLLAGAGLGAAFGLLSRLSHDKG